MVIGGLHCQAASVARLSCDIPTGAGKLTAMGHTALPRRLRVATAASMAKCAVLVLAALVAASGAAHAAAVVRASDATPRDHPSDSPQPPYFYDVVLPPSGPVGIQVRLRVEVWATGSVCRRD